MRMLALSPGLPTPPREAQMKRIAVEEHFLTREVKDAWAAAAADDPTSAFDGGDIGAHLQDLGTGRLALTDEAGVDAPCEDGFHKRAASQQLG